MLFIGNYYSTELSSAWAFVRSIILDMLGAC